METNTVVIVVVGVFALLVIILACSGRWSKFVARIKAPLGLGLNVAATDNTRASPQGAKIEGSVSKQGSITADDSTGAGASIRDCTAKQDITAKTAAPGGGPGPKR